MTRHDEPRADVDEPHILRRAPRHDTGGGENVIGLLKQLVSQGSHLAEQQLALIKAEIRESTSELKTAVGAMVGAVVVGLAGLGVTLMGVAYLLGQAIHNTAAATFIVGAATLVLAYVLYHSGAKKMGATHLSPERSERTLLRTPDAVRGDLQTEKRP